MNALGWLSLVGMGFSAGSVLAYLAAIKTAQTQRRYLWNPQTAEPFLLDTQGGFPRQNLKNRAAENTDFVEDDRNFQVAVVMPARNEAARIVPTLLALSTSIKHYQKKNPHITAYICDDDSSDDTAKIITETITANITETTPSNTPHMRLLSLPALPLGVGEYGKPRALARAVSIINDERKTKKENPIYLWIFLDADVVVTADAIEKLCNFFREQQARNTTTKKVGALSGAPRLQCTTLAEEMLVPAVVGLVALAHAPSKIRASEGTQQKTAFLNGQLIVVSNEALCAAGGWESVTKTVLEDVKMGYRIQDAGYEIVLGDLQSIASTRMYTGWRDAWLGFGKNMIPALGGDHHKNQPLRLSLLACGLAWSPWLGIFCIYIDQFYPKSSSQNLVNTNTNTHTQILLGAVLAWCLVVFLQMYLRKQASLRGWPALLSPITYLAVLCLVVQSLYRWQKKKPIEWKGRRYESGQ